MKLSRILNKTIDYLTEYPKRMCGSNSNKGKGVNKLLAPYDISEASIKHKLVLFGKEPLYSLALIEGKPHTTTMITTIRMVV